MPLEPDARFDAILKGFAPIVSAISKGCGFGLDLFFALSAFLICELLVRERAINGTVGVKQFYIRRILRIWPLYYLGLAIGAVVAIVPGGHRADLVDMAWYSVFMGGWYSLVHGATSGPMGPLWSISVEEQFYLFAPWVVRWFKRKLLYSFCAVLILVANLWLYYLGSTGMPEQALWFNSFVHFECFAAGILLCLVLRGRLPKIALAQRLLLLMGAFACWFYACYGLHVRVNGMKIPGAWDLIGGYALVSLGCVAVLLAFLGVNPKLLPGWAVYLGRISFGLYVFHRFAAYLVSKLMIGHLASFSTPVYLLKGALALALTVLMAAASYRYFETPFLKIKKRHATIESQPA